MDRFEPDGEIPAKPLTLLAGARVLCDDHLEQVDVLIAAGRIMAVGPTLVGHLPDALLSVHDLSGLTLVPGLIDAHVHFLGGGGGDGYSSRIPEMSASQFTLAGITTAVGSPGIDMVSRSIEGLLAKAYGLQQDGISTFVYVGGFLRPPLTVTGDVWRDLYLLPAVRGVKIAIGEDRASPYGVEDLIRIAKELAWAERASGRRAVLHVHLGRGEGGTELLTDILSRVPFPDRIVVTHCNYSRTNLEAAPGFARMGAYVDMTSVMSPERGTPDAIPASEAIGYVIRSGVDPTRVTVSSDGNGEVPAWTGTRWEPYLTHVESLLEEIRLLSMQVEGSLPTALRHATTNVARALGLEGRKGRIAVGLDADLVTLDDRLDVVDVYAKGRLVVRQGQPVVRDRFERAPQPAARG